MLAGHSGYRPYTSSLSDHLQATAAQESGVSRPLSTDAVNSILVGFTYKLQYGRRAVLACPMYYSTSAGFTYKLQPRSREVLAGHPAPLSDPLTACSSQGAQC